MAEAGDAQQRGISCEDEVFDSKSGDADSDIEQLPLSSDTDTQNNQSEETKYDIKSKGDNLQLPVGSNTKQRLSESSSDGFLNDSPSVENRSRLTSTDDTDSTIKPERIASSDSSLDSKSIEKTANSDSSSDSKSIETIDYTSSEEKSFETIDSEDDKANTDSANRPESLVLKKPVQYEKRRSRSDEHKKIDTRTMSASTAVTIPVGTDPEFMNIEETMLSKSLPHGKVLRKGEMIEFVADDLQEMIKRSSPLTQTASSPASSRRSSLRSYSSLSSSTSSAIASGISRSPSSQFPQSPDDIPPIDPQAIHDLEMHALKVADNLDHLMGNLKSNLHKMSAITVGCLSAYKTSVDTTCDSVDSSIKAMYALMAKCEELSKSMKPVNKLAEQIKEIKRLLDRFETQIADKP